jgi:hypothetical protein
MSDSTQELGLERLQRAPVISRILASEGGDQTLKLIKATVAPDCTDAEVGHFLELCSVYGLDPFAREAWCAKGKPRGGEPGRLLIMVGRDGLRKIAQRNGIHVDGDVVRKNDTLTITRSSDGNRTVEHAWSAPAERGEIIGAWAECREGGPLGRPLGFFFAPLSEYKPANVSNFSPWSKQEGVMILAAAERQAIRQATPLGGLLAEGEDESANAARTIGAGVGSGEAPEWRGLTDEQIAAAERVFAKAREVGHAGLADEASRRMELNGQPAM